MHWDVHPRYLFVKNTTHPCFKLQKIHPYDTAKSSIYSLWYTVYKANLLCSFASISLHIIKMEMVYISAIKPKDSTTSTLKILVLNESLVLS